MTQHTTTGQQIAWQLLGWGLLLLGWVLLAHLCEAGIAEASTRGIPGVRNGVILITDTIKDIVWYLGGALLVMAVIASRTDHGVYALWGIGITIAIIAIALWADDIMTTIGPSRAAASTGMLYPSALTGWLELGSTLARVALFTEGIRRVRRRTPRI